MTQVEEHEFITISPPVPWERIRRDPALNGPNRLKWHGQYIRVSGAHDRDDDGRPWDDLMRRGPVDRVTLTYYSTGVVEGRHDAAIRFQLQRLLDKLPEHEFTGAINLHEEYSPLRLHRRLEVIQRRAVITRPTVSWDVIKPLPQADYAGQWPVLVGYAQQARDDGTQIDPGDLLGLLVSLRREAQKPVRDWMAAITDRAKPAP